MVWSFDFDDLNGTILVCLITKSARFLGSLKFSRFKSVPVFCLKNLTNSFRKVENAWLAVMVTIAGR